MVFEDQRDSLLVEDPRTGRVFSIIAGSQDPRVDGARALEGSLFLRSTGEIFRKVGPLNTDWELMDDGGGIQELSFSAATWAAGTPNEIEIVRAPAVPGPGQIGPHALGLGVAYMTQVFEDLGGGDLTIVDVQVTINVITGLVTLRKAPVAADFDGRVIIEDPL